MGNAELLNFTWLKRWGKDSTVLEMECGGAAWDY